MLGCAVFIKAISLSCFLSSVQQNKFDTGYPSTRSGITANNSGGMNSNAIGNDNIDDGWADVSKKKKEPNKNKISKQHNPYIEVIDPVSSDSNDSAPQRHSYEPFMVLLVGLPGSGKSTFAQSLVASTPNKFCRINQDELKTRPKCERRLKQVLSASPSLPSQSESQSESKQQRLCPIIDRCNFDTKQRSTWYQLAKEAAGQGSLPMSTTTTKTSVDANEKTEPGTETTVETELASLALTTTTTTLGIPVDVVVLDLPYEECLRRCAMRKGHETIKSPQQAAGILKQLRSQWNPPHHPKNKGEESRYRSLTIVRSDRERKECMLRILKQTF